VEKYFEENRHANPFVLDFVNPKSATDPAYPVIKKVLGSNGYVSQVSFASIILR